MIQSAATQLTDLAVAVRPEWDRDEVSLALVAAHNAGWAWPRTLLATVRLMVTEDATPHDLTVAVASPLERQPGGDWKRGAAYARDLLEHRGEAS